jgi:hypothetical protein
MSDETPKPSFKFKVKTFIDSAQVKKDLAYSPSSLSDAFMQQASMFAHYGVLGAQASKQVDDFKLTLETWQAKVARDIRDQKIADGEKSTEASIAAEVANHSKIIALKRALNEAKQIEASAKVVVEAFRHRRDMLIQDGLRSREELKGELSMAARKIHDDERKQVEARVLEAARERH